MSDASPFTPDWVSPPGDTISTILEERQIAKSAFARAIKISTDDLEELLEGSRELSSELATRLASTLGSSPGFWTRRELRYRQDLERLQQNASIASNVAWLEEISAKEIEAFGWTQGTGRSIPSTIAECLRFFGVPNVKVWRESYKEVLQAVAFRTSPTFKSQPRANASQLH